MSVYQIWKIWNWMGTINSSLPSATKGSVNWISIGSGYGLSPAGAKPLPELMMVYHTPAQRLEMTWFPERNPSLLLNFDFKFH